ncbi:MAG: citryl-CoA lyase [Candidatus Spechtbacterales bacterium]
MKWRTSISEKRGEEQFVRGYSLKGLMASASFAEATFLLMRGAMPTKEEATLFNAMLVACIEHGVEPPSAFMARVAASTGNAMNAALASGVLAISEFHGGAIEAAALLLQSEKSATQIVAEAKAAGTFIPGLGHKVYKDVDPRADFLFKKAEELRIASSFCAKEKEIQEELVATGVTLPINIDGALAALMSDMGFDWRLGKALFILGRLPGMIAHAHEEMVNEKPYRRISPEDIEYIGPPPHDEV